MGYPIDTMLDFNELRAKQGVEGVVVAVMGGKKVPPQNYGFFYWEDGSYLPDDNKWYIRVAGVTSGQWVRSPTGGLHGAAKIFNNQTLSFTDNVTPSVIPFNDADYIKGSIRIEASKIISVDRPGNLELNIQLNVSTTQEGTIDIWIRKNGIENITNSRLNYSILKDTSSPISLTRNYEVNTGDYYEIMAVPSNTNIKLAKETIANRPDVLSVQVVAKLFNQIMF